MMAMPDLCVRLVKELKGAPLSVWMALMCSGGVPVTLSWLARNTGYSAKPTRSALAYLFEHGFVTRIEGGWIVSDRHTQMTLKVPPDSEGPECEVEDPELEGDQVELPNSDTDGQIGKNSLPPNSIVNNDFNDSIKTHNTNSESGKKSSPAHEFSDFPDLGQALLEIGIRENIRTRRLLGRITPRDVRSMVARIRDDPFHDLGETGLMVTILEGVAERNQLRSGYESWNS